VDLTGDWLELEDRKGRDRGMEAYDVWKFLHIASTFAAVSIFVGHGMVTKPFS
jgi:hypothetical protein